MRRAALIVGVATALLVAAGNAPSAGVAGETNFGVQILTLFDDETGAVILGAVTAGKAFVLPTFVGRYKLPGEPEDDPVNTAAALSATYALDLPAGLQVQPAAQVRGGGFQGTSTTCVAGCAVDIPSGRLGTNVLFRLVAASAGTYTVRLRIVSASATDPDPSNDQMASELRAQATAAAKVTAGKAVASPAVPRAGKPYALSLPLTKGGQPATASVVRCSATLGAKALRGVTARLPGRARCTWKIPAGTAGQTLRARLAATADGKAFTASRTARVR